MYHIKKTECVIANSVNWLYAVTPSKCMPLPQHLSKTSLHKILCKKLSNIFFYSIIKSIMPNTATFIWENFYTRLFFISKLIKTVSEKITLHFFSYGFCTLNSITRKRGAVKLWFFEQFIFVVWPWNGKNMKQKYLWEGC